MRDDSVSLALARAAMAHRARAAELLAPAGLHPGQEVAMGHLARHGDLALGELARRLGVEPATVTKMVRRLEAGGFVERRPDPDDGRSSRVSLTAAGERAVTAAEAAWARLEDETVAGLTASQRTALRDGLAAVRANLGADRDPFGC